MPRKKTAKSSVDQATSTPFAALPSQPAKRGPGRPRKNPLPVLPVTQDPISLAAESNHAASSVPPSSSLAILPSSPLTSGPTSPPRERQAPSAESEISEILIPSTDTCTANASSPQTSLHLRDQTLPPSIPSSPTLVDDEMRKRKRTKVISPLPRKRWRSNTLSTMSDDYDVPRQMTTKDLMSFISMRADGTLPKHEEKAVKVVEEPDEEEEEPFAASKLPLGAVVGEALYVKKSRCYWPAKLVDFIPATNQIDKDKGRDRFVVQIRGHSGSEIVTRKNVVFRVDKEIARISLGEVKTTRKAYIGDAYTRPPTPPLDPDPLTPSPYDELSRQTQLRLIRPHLQSILLEQYPPAQEWIDAFHTSRGQRNGLAAHISYGDVAEQELTAVILPELERWALRRERWAIQDGIDTRPSEPSRPNGSTRYEALSTTGRRQFISTILLREALVQLCILSMELHLDTPENAHQAAVEQLEELSHTNPELEWEFLIKRLREARKRMRAELGMEPEGMSASEKREWNSAKEKTEIIVSWTGRHRKRGKTDVGKVGDVLRGYREV